MDLSEKETLLRSSEHEAFLSLAQQELKDMKYYKAVLETGKLLAEGGFEIIIGGSGIVELTGQVELLVHNIEFPLSSIKPMRPYSK